MKKDRLKKEVYSSFVLISQIGIHMLAPIFLCVAIGVFIDKKYNTYLTLPLLIMGILAGGRNAYALAKSANRISEEELENEEEQRMVDGAIEKWNEGKQFTGNEKGSSEDQRNTTSKN